LLIEEPESAISINQQSAIRNQQSAIRNSVRRLHKDQSTATLEYSTG